MTERELRAVAEAMYPFSWHVVRFRNPQQNIGHEVAQAYKAADAVMAELNSGDIKAQENQAGIEPDCGVADVINPVSSDTTDLKSQPKEVSDVGEEYPAGAIVNGRIFIDRIKSDEYDALDIIWKLERCFEHLVSCIDSTRHPIQPVVSRTAIGRGEFNKIVQALRSEWRLADKMGATESTTEEMLTIAVLRAINIDVKG